MLVAPRCAAAASCIPPSDGVLPAGTSRPCTTHPPLDTPHTPILPPSHPRLAGGCKRQHVAPPALPLRRAEEKQQRQQRLQGLLDLFEGLPLPPSPVAVERRICVEHEAPAVAPAADSAGALPLAGPAAAAAAAWVQPADTPASRSPSPQAAAQQADAGGKLQLLACVASMQQDSPSTQQAAAAASPPPTAAAGSPPASSPPAPAPPGPTATGSPRPPLPPQLRPQLRQLKRLLAMLGALQAAAAQPEWRAAAARQPATAAVLRRLMQLSRAQQLPLCSLETLQGLLAQFCGCA